MYATLHEKRTGKGRIVRFQSATAKAEACFQLAPPAAYEQWLACHRSQSCWMEPATGRKIDLVPDETQMLLFQCGDRYTVYIPLVKDGFRASLFSDNGALCVRIESGSPQVRAKAFDAVYVNEGRDPYALMHEAAEELHHELNSFSRPAEHPRPRFMDALGWCSWNAFYEEVSEEKITQMLERFEREGLCPGFVIIDAGWQSSTEWHLTGLGCNASKFPDGLGTALQRIKSRFGVKHLFLWQTYNGFWCGLDPAAFPDARRTRMEPPPRLLSKSGKNGKDQFDTSTETFYPEQILDKDFWQPASFERFYEAYHRQSAEAGADGVKIDAITWIEACGKDHGGRVALMREFLRGAEKGSNRYFDGEVIWCSSCSNDFLLNSRGGGVVRTSPDFFPDKPETHGRHIHTNVLNSLFMGAFARPDWDMFQTALGAASEFHAAARAISGGPVYTTDAIGKENFELIRKLVRADGTIPLCETHARPTLDTLFSDPQESLVKVFNHTKVCHLLGVFNTAYEKGDKALRSGRCSVADVHPLRNSTAEFALYRHNDRSVRPIGLTETIALSLPALGFELFTIGEIKDGFSPIGDPGLLNPSGVVLGWDVRGGEHRVELKGCRNFFAFSKCPPRNIVADGKPIRFEWRSGALRTQFPPGFSGTIQLKTDSPQ